MEVHDLSTYKSQRMRGREENESINAFAQEKKDLMPDHPKILGTFVIPL